MVTDLLWNAAQRMLTIPVALAQPAVVNDQPAVVNPTTKIKIFDPLEGETFASLLARILDGLVLLAIPVVTIMVMVGAYFIITSGGNPAKRTKGKDYILWAAIGFAILLLAESVALIVKNFIEA